MAEHKQNMEIVASKKNKNDSRRSLFFPKGPHVSTSDYLLKNNCFDNNVLHSFELRKNIISKFLGCLLIDQNDSLSEGVF